MRHLSRHLQATVQNHVREHLEFLDWIGPATDTPFGALPVDYQTVKPSEALLKSVAPNLVAVSFGSQTDDREEELGGGLVSQEHIVFVDVYAENEGVGLALAEDIRDLLTGRASYLSHPSRFVKLHDQTTQPPTPVPGYLLEFTEVFREPAEREIGSVDWQVIRASAYLHLPGES